MEGTHYWLYFARRYGSLCGRIVGLSELRRHNRLPAAFKELRKTDLRFTKFRESKPDRLNPQETTTQGARDMGLDGAELFCPW